MNPPSDSLGELCSDEEFVKFTGGCTYRGHFPDFKQCKSMVLEGQSEFTCPRCLHVTKFDMENAAYKFTDGEKTITNIKE